MPVGLFQMLVTNGIMYFPLCLQKNELVILHLQSLDTEYDQYSNREPMIV